MHLTLCKLHFDEENFELKFSFFLPPGRVPFLMRRILSKGLCLLPEAVETYCELGNKRGDLPKLFHQASIVEMVIVMSSNTSRSTLTVSRDVNIVVFVSTARRLIS